MIVDIHTHLAAYECYPRYFIEGIVDEAVRSFDDNTRSSARKKILRHVVKNSLQDAACTRLLLEMDAAGIDKAVLLILDLGFGRTGMLSLERIYELYRGVLARHSRRFIVFAGIDPRRGRQGLRLVERSFSAFQFRGLKLYPPCGFELDDRSLFPFYELCAEYNLPVLAHTGPSLEKMSVSRRYPESVRRMAARFNTVQFILGHAGVRDLDCHISLAHEFCNVFLDISGFQSRLSGPGRFRCDLARMIDEVSKKVLFGTDWPMFRLHGDQKKWVCELAGLQGASPSSKADVLGQNACRLLNLEDANS